MRIARHYKFALDQAFLNRREVRIWYALWQSAVERRLGTLLAMLSNDGWQAGVACWFLCCDDGSTQDLMQPVLVTCVSACLRPSPGHVLLTPDVLGFVYHGFVLPA